MAALEPYYFEPNMLQSPKNDSTKDSEVGNHLEKIHFGDLVKDAKSLAGFSASHQFQVGQNDIT